MKKIITAFVFCFLCGECFSQAGEWVWIKGDSIPNQPGNYGVQGVPSPTNNPPGLYEPCEWTDLNGNFWLFGGSGVGGMYCDLWKYNSITNEWTWTKGPGVPMSPIYGTLGVPDLNNNPGSRSWGVSTWTDTTGNLWLFGGIAGGVKNDLWRYNIQTNEWTWMSGNAAENYGTMGVPSPTNLPPPRRELAANWTDMQNNLWFYGGTSGPGSGYGDLWNYSISSGMWTWVSGSNIVNSLPVYGVQGIPSTLNTPGARWPHSKWKDNAGNFWFFGGHTTDYTIMTNDLWKYNPVTNEWTWVNGPAGTNLPGSEGMFCSDSTIYYPHSRSETRACWKDVCDNFWLYGGYSLLPGTQYFADLWKYDIALNSWTLIDSAISNSIPIYGIQGVPNPLNYPGGRFGAISWKDTAGSFWLFGGRSTFSALGDLWKYTPDTSCGGCTTSTDIQENNFTNDLLVFPNPTNSSLTISFLSSEKQNIELRIYNTLGQLQLFQSFETLEKVFKKEINVEKWSEGIYFLQVKMKDGNRNRKVIVSHP